MKSVQNTIKAILHPYEDDLGPDYDAYLNHTLRVYTYSCILLLNRENQKIAIASAFHDLDIWVSKTLDYLPGSSKMSREYIRDHQLNLLPDELEFIISNHHKLRKIKGNMEAEAFRKADLIDLTSGLIRFNIPQSLITETERKYPRKNFTGLVLKKTLRHAITHPFRPFPMFRI